MFDEELYFRGIDEYEEQDVEGLLKNRLEEAKDRLNTALEAIIALCEPVHPQNEINFIKYFCGNSGNPEDLKSTEELWVALYLQRFP